RPAASQALERAWPLFHVAQLCGLDASIAERWTAGDVAEIESELQELDGVRRRRILHQAFERAIRHRVYDALMRHTQQDLRAPIASPNGRGVCNGKPPASSATTCIWGAGFPFAVRC